MNGAAKMHRHAQVPLQRMYDVFQCESRSGLLILLPHDVVDDNDDDIVHGGRHREGIVQEEERNRTSQDGRFQAHQDA